MARSSRIIAIIIVAALIAGLLAALAMIAANHQLVRCANIGGYCGLLIIRPESSMHEPDDF